ncbi:transcription antitermination factor NusB [Agathobacter sp.]
MTRSKIRENVFKMLFRVEFHDADELSEQLELLNDELENPTDADKEYIDKKSNDIIAHIDEIDALIDEKSTGWKTKRMAKVDLAIIRLAVYEIKFEDDIPTKVSINEAVELAKKFGADESPAFVNGVLAKFA